MLSAREMNPDLHIVAKTNSKESARKLKVAGADRTISPYAVSGRRLARLAIHPLIVDYLDIVTRSETALEFHLEEFEVEDGSLLANRTLGELRVVEQTGIKILALRHRDGEFNTSPLAQSEILPGDILIVLGTNEQIGRLERLAED